MRYRHLHLVVDHDAASTDFPPTYGEFEAARQRFFARLIAEADVAGRAPADAESPEEASRP